jgi:hypothetical protein
MKVYEDHFYGDETRWFIGTVVDVSGDPLQIGRVLVRIYGLHDPDPLILPDAFLPWAPCVIPTTEGGTSGVGFNPGIRKGAQVFGMFIDGKKCQMPIIIGSIAKIENATPATSAGNATNTFDGNNATATDGNVPANNPGSAENISANADSVHDYFMSQGFTPEQASAITAHLNSESGLNPSAINPNDAGAGQDSVGIAQWNRERLQGLKDYSATRGLDWQSLDAQLQYVVHELNTTERGAGSRLRNAESLEDAVVAFSWYERYGGGLEQADGLRENDYRRGLASPETQRRLETAREIHRSNG